MVGVKQDDKKLFHGKDIRVRTAKLVIQGDTKLAVQSESK